MNQVFPSLAHQLSLQETPYSTLNEQYRREYHSYIYAWRRKYLYDHNKSSNLDPQGKYYDSRMIDTISRMLYPSRQPNPRITQAYEEAAKGNYELAANLRDQDRHRAETMATIEGDGRNPDGSWSDASLAFSALCVQQATANLAAFITQTTRPWRRPTTDREALARTARELGVRATERKQS